MDWNKYKSYTNGTIPDAFYGTIFECGCYSNINSTFTGTTFDDAMDGVVADVTDSYKELSSERVKEQC